MGRMRTGSFMLYQGTHAHPKAMVRLEGTSLKVGTTGDFAPRLHVKLVDGWEKDGNWGGYLQITSDAYEGYYIDSSSGWLTPVSSKVDPITFFDRGDWYEIWQKDPEHDGRPITIADNEQLRFVKGATGDHFNILDS
ncbi:hypothetical protein ABZ736_28035 [Streptomyces sp. NPDC013099]|uniref:hypothetical protein n=1 Tax=Streptomyces sp. NPDC013099 TaxID=3156687 RepID=UPI0033DF6ABC